MIDAQKLFDEAMRQVDPADLPRRYIKGAKVWFRPDAAYFVAVNDLDTHDYPIGSSVELIVDWSRIKRDWFYCYGDLVSEVFAMGCSVNLNTDDR